MICQSCLARDLGLAKMAKGMARTVQAGRELSAMLQHMGWFWLGLDGPLGGSGFSGGTGDDEPVAASG